MEFNARIFSFTGTRSNPLNMLRPRLLTSSAPQSAWRTRRERRSLQNFMNNIKGLFVNLSQRRFFLESWLKKIQDANASAKWSKMKRDAAFRNVHTKSLTVR
jgi:hypothetical protein